MTEFNYPLRIPAIKVEQPLGSFFVASIEASVLLEVSYSTPARIIEAKEGGYNIIGSQRGKRSDRLREISRFIDQDEAAFPNSIILGVNIHEDGRLEENVDKRWHIEKSNNNDFYYIVIPSSAKMSSIIDGQHRLFSFKKSDRKSMPLLCAVYLDLPLPYHAYLFATININQKKVDKSLAYELFGFGIEDNDSETWSPEVYAVYISRVMNTEDDSPFCGHIGIGVLDDDNIINLSSWTVSLATVVDGILKLITANPKRDRDEISKFSLIGKKSRSRLSSDDAQPLRNMYLQNKDRHIYDLICCFFNQVNTTFWKNASDRSYIIKTVGIQALFDILKLILKGNKDLLNQDDLNLIDFEPYIIGASTIDFSDPFFQASGKGRGRIKNIIGACCNLIDLNKLRTTSAEIDEYRKVLKHYKKQ